MICGAQVHNLNISQSCTADKWNDIVACMASFDRAHTRHSDRSEPAPNYTSGIFGRLEDWAASDCTPSACL
eukprot:2007504-Karenia_brevis.AAC.1